MHGHEPFEQFEPILSGIGVASIAVIVAVVLFTAGVLPIPVGYERGKIKWVTWCGTGMHAHTVYWHGENDGRTDQPGFQTIHPEDVTEG